MVNLQGLEKQQRKNFLGPTRVGMNGYGNKVTRQKESMK